MNVKNITKWLNNIKVGILTLQANDVRWSK